MNTPPDEDPWDRTLNPLHDADRDKPDPADDEFKPVRYTKGEIACCVVFLVGVITGISLLAAEIIDQFFKLP